MSTTSQQLIPGCECIAYQASSPDTLFTAHGDVAARATELLNSDTNERTEESTQGSDKLRAHSSSLRKSGLYEKSEIANLVGNLVEEDCYGSGSSDGRRGIETGRHGQAVGDVVCKVGTVSVSTVPKDQSREINIHKVQVTTQLDARVDFLLRLLNSIGNNSTLVLVTLLARLDKTIRSINSGRNSLILTVRLSVRITMCMGVIMTSSTCSNS
jgi:hypothetical protein